MRAFHTFCCLLLPCLVFLAACAPKRPGELGGAARAEVKESGQKPVAQVGQQVITRQDLEVRLKELSLYEGRLGSPEQRRDFLGAYVTMVAMGQDAKKRGLEKAYGATVRGALDEAIAAVHEEAVLAKAMGAHQVTQAQLEAAYDPGAHTLPRRWQVVEVQVATEAFAGTLRDRLAGVPATRRLKEARAMAARHGVGQEVAARAGAGEVVAEDKGAFAQAVRTQGEAGGVTPVVKENGVWKFALVYGIKPSQSRPFEAVAESLRAALTKKARAKFRATWITRLRQTYKPQIDQHALKSLTPPDAVLAISPPESF